MGFWFDFVSTKYARTSSDLVRHEPNSIEMGAMLNHNLATVLVCKWTSSDLASYEPNSIEMGARLSDNHHTFNYFEGFVEGVAHEAKVDIIGGSKARYALGMRGLFYEII